MWSEHFDMLNKSEKNDKILLVNNMIVDIAVITSENYEKFFNKIEKTSLTTVELKKRVSVEFHEFINIWNLKEINKISSRREIDHSIELVQEAKSSAKKAYELSRKQATVIKKYVDEMLDKEFIRRSTSDYVSSVLIVKKLDEELRVCIDYRALNALTIKNRNASSLIREILTRLCAIKFYSKFDIIAAFNEIRMKEDDETKTAFLIRYDFFEYVVMSFDLCNASETF